MYDDKYTFRYHMGAAITFDNIYLYCDNEHNSGRLKFKFSTYINIFYFVSFKNSNYYPKN